MGGRDGRVGRGRLVPRDGGSVAAVVSLSAGARVSGIDNASGSVVLGFDVVPCP